jgi:hypothetical protein
LGGESLCLVALYDANVSDGGETDFAVEEKGGESLCVALYGADDTDGEEIDFAVDKEGGKSLCLALYDADDADGSDGGGMNGKNCLLSIFPNEVWGSSL